VSLAAEVLPIRRLAGRIKTASSLGFDRFIAGDKVHDLKGAIRLIFEK
jgi:predicted ATP-dependent serine protease